MKKKEFDLVVVGGGPGGYVAAIRGAQLGLRTALVEKAELGGICLNWGCIPTKALLRSADVLRLVRNSSQFGIEAGTPIVHLSAMVARSRSVAGQLQRGVMHLMKKNKITVLNGHASLHGRHMLKVTQAQGEVLLAAKHIVLATGARARELPGLAPDGCTLWSYRDALTPKELPERLLIIGAGAIGIEFASFYHALGSQVSVVEIADRVLPLEDAEVSACVGAELATQGIQLHTGCSVKSVRRVGAAWEVELEGRQTSIVAANVILSAVGIVGNVENLGLEGTGVKVEKTHIVTDAYGCTGEPGVYAIGDVAGAPWLAHKASHEAVICIEKLVGLKPHVMDMSQIPSCTYSYPQVASVGMTEAQARATGSSIRIGKAPFAANGKAVAMGAAAGFVKVVFDASSGEMLGAHMVGDDVTELIQGYAIARELESSEEELMATIFPHPSLSESMHEAVLAAYERALSI
jgi:dihydrolipoamide dehydrogenase